MFNSQFTRGHWLRLCIIQGLKNYYRKWNARKVMCSQFPSLNVFPCDNAPSHCFSLHWRFSRAWTWLLLLVVKIIKRVVVFKSPVEAWRNIVQSKVRTVCSCILQLLFHNQGHHLRVVSHGILWAELHNLKVQVLSNTVFSVAQVYRCTIKQQQFEFFSRFQSDVTISFQEGL